MFLIFPHQLFYDISHLTTKDKIYLIEEPRFFTDFKFHKLKLAYNRATMRRYYDYLLDNNLNVKYITFDKVDKNFYKQFTEIICIEPNDHKLISRLINPMFIPNKNFLVATDEFDNIRRLIYKNSRYHHDAFYKYQRIKLNILIDSDNKPIGGKWTFDTENRLPLPKNYIAQRTPTTKNKSNKYIKEAIKYINDNFESNYGDLSVESFIFPIDNKESIKWLKIFLKKRLENFGKYEDAIHSNDNFIYHSVISPMMNIGILTDREVIKHTLKYYKKNHNQIPLTSIEAFIRQIIGWRNYVYVLYMLEGKNMYETNQLKHKNDLPYKHLWEASTNILPVDDAIKNIIKYSYTHHIQRLMVLGSYLLLLEIDPKEVYRIFMEWTIDAYDWVMVPNIFGMSQFATPQMMTRPYFTSYNYLLKMSNYKNAEWCEIWKALYYSFINRHQKLLAKNYAFASQVSNWKKKSTKEKKELLQISNEYKKTIY